MIKFIFHLLGPDVSLQFYHFLVPVKTFQHFKSVCFSPLCATMIRHFNSANTINPTVNYFNFYSRHGLKVLPCLSLLLPSLLHHHVPTWDHLPIDRLGVCFSYRFTVTKSLNFLSRGRLEMFCLFLSLGVLIEYSRLPVMCLGMRTCCPFSFGFHCLRGEVKRITVDFLNGVLLDFLFLCSFSVVFLQRQASSRSSVLTFVALLPRCLSARLSPVWGTPHPFSLQTQSAPSPTFSCWDSLHVCVTPSRVPCVSLAPWSVFSVRFLPFTLC